MSVRSKRPCQIRWYRSFPIREGPMDCDTTGGVKEFGKYIRVAVKVMDNEAWVSTAFLTDRLV